MTDNEIIKALEYCRRTDRYVICNSDCPMYEYCESDEEGEMNICGLALNLINCQKAEVEMLQKEIESLNKEYPCTVKMNDYCLVYARSLNDYDNLIGDISKDAIKEFADRLKNNIDNGQLYVDNEDYVLTIYHISNLVKEMTEAKE